MAAISLVSAPAVADDETPSPSYLLQEAIVRYKMADYEKVISLVDKALAANPTTSEKTRSLVYKGMSLQILGQESNAENAFTDALTLSPLHRLAPKGVKPSIVALFDRVRAKLGKELTIKADHPAKVFLDGKEIGTTPLRFKFSLGQYALRLETDDNLYRATTQLRVMPDSPAELTVSLTAHSGRLTITSTPTGALVRSQGKILGRTPLKEYLLPAGKVTLMVELANHQPHPVSAEVAALGKVSHHVKLKRIVIAPPGGTPLKKKPRLYTWIALGAAGIAGIVGMGFGISAQRARTDFETAAESGNIDGYYATAESQQTLGNAANISFITAGGLVVAAAILFFVEGTLTEKPKAKRSNRVSLSPGRLLLGGSF